MEMHPEYIRDMHNHYMILKGNTEDKQNYTAKMLMNNSVPGIIQTELRYLDSLDLYYYDITSKKTIKSIYDGKPIDYVITKNLVKEVLQIIENSQEYLLIEHDFIITPEFIFLDNNNQVGLCYMPGFSNNILEQLSYLFEYLMNKIDYKDELAVRLIYALYKESKDVECTFYKLYEVMEQTHVKPDIEKKKTRKEDINHIKDEGLEAKIIDFSSANEELLIRKNTFKREFQPISSKNLINKVINNINSLKNKVGNESYRHENTENPMNNNGYKNNIDYKNNIKNIDNRNNKIHKTNKSTKTNIQNRCNPSNNNSAARINPKKTKITSANYHIKGEIDKSEVINEKELLYFSTSSYIKAGSSILIGIVMLVITYFSGIINNALGSGVDSVKLFACFLMVICVEIYIMSKIFDPNNRITKMVTVLEYITEDKCMDFDKNENVFKNESVDKKENREVDSSIINNQSIKFEDDSISNVGNLNAHNRDKEDNTQILWNDYMGGEEETQILTYLNKPKYFHLTPIKTKINSKEKSTKVKVLEYPFYIGKSIENVNMVIEDKSISRKHGVITCMENTVQYTDLDSTNGTFINGIKLEGNKAYTLSPYDEISFANLKYLWEELEEE